MSMLFISHDLGVVGEIADHVVVMRHGDRARARAGRRHLRDSAGCLHEGPAGLPADARASAAPRLRVVDDHIAGRAAATVGKAKDPSARVDRRGSEPDEELLDPQRRVRPAEFQAVKGATLPAARRPHARHRRRVGLRQDHARPDAAAPARSERRAGRRPRVFDGRDLLALSKAPRCWRCESASRSSSRTPTPRSIRASRSARRWSSR